MRIIVYGIGAIGGAIAAQLSFSGYPVVGIARGKQLDAVRVWNPGARARTTESIDVLS